MDFPTIAFVLPAVLAGVALIALVAVALFNIYFGHKNIEALVQLNETITKTVTDPEWIKTMETGFNQLPEASQDLIRKIVAIADILDEMTPGQIDNTVVDAFKKITEETPTFPAQ